MMSAGTVQGRVACPVCGDLIEVPLTVNLGPVLSKALADASSDLNALAGVRFTPDNGPALDHLREKHPEVLASLTPEAVGLVGGGQLPDEAPETGKGGINL